MRVLIAPDAFDGTLTAGQAAAAMAQGWAQQAPDDVLLTCPLSDGGPGFVDVLLEALDGDLVPLTVTGPLGEPVPATLLLVADAHGRVTAYLESAQACGRHLVAPGHGDPTRTTSSGVGELVSAAVAAGAGRVVVGCGAAASHDGGAGLLAALGAGAADLLGRGGLALADLPESALADLAAVRDALAGVELVVATDVDLPLLGFHGASAVDAQHRGASAEQAQQLEAALGRYVEVAQRSLVAARPLVGRGLAATAGSGAGGGLAFGLSLLGAQRVSGVRAVLDAVGFERRLTEADVVLTGEGTFDWASLRGQVVAEVATAALALGVPTVVVAGQVAVGRREALAAGIAASYAVAESPDRVAQALADPAGTLAARTRRVARTWSG